MTSLQAHIIDQFEYTLWAARLHAKAIQSSGLENNERMLWLFNHIHNARVFWLKRLITENPTFETTTLSIPELIDQMAISIQNWINYIASISEEQLYEVKTFQRKDGGSINVDVLSIAIQNVSHATHHFGEFIPIMRQAGATPLQTDYVYYRFTGKQ